jgi:alkyldihydroxyacetonephosphate synthase
VSDGPPSFIPPAPGVTVDEDSLLADCPAGVTLRAIESALAPLGLTLGVDGSLDRTVGEWIEAGAPGAPSPFADPADHLIAGLVATSAAGERLVVKPAPRRSVGPDLVALVFGQGGRFFALESAWLRAHRKDAPRVALAHGVRSDPDLTAAERGLLDRIAAELAPR